MRSMASSEVSNFNGDLVAKYAEHSFFCAEDIALNDFTPQIVPDGRAVTRSGLDFLLPLLIEHLKTNVSKLFRSHPLLTSPFCRNLINTWSRERRTAGLCQTAHCRLTADGALPACSGLGISRNTPKGALSKQAIGAHGLQS